MTKAVFFGNIDPFHLGHQELLERALKDYPAIYIPINIRSSVDPLIVKTNIALIIQSLQNIHTISKEELMNTKNIVGIIGLKQFQHLQQETYPLPKVGKWMVYYDPKSPQFDKYGIYLQNSPVEFKIIFNAKFQHITSKYAKEVLRSPNAPPNIPISEKAYRIFKKKNLYVLSKDLQAIQQNVEKFLKKESLITNGKNLKFLTHSGHSGDLIFFVENSAKEKELFIKVYQGGNFKSELISQEKSLDLIRGIGQKYHFSSPKIKGRKLFENFGALVLESAKGEDVGHNLKHLSTVPHDSLEYSSLLNKLEMHSKKIGITLGHLHASTQQHFLPSEQMFNKIQNTLHANTKNLPLSETTYIKSLFEKLKKNPGKLSHIHGDANPNNFFISSTGNVTLIDAGGRLAHNSVDGIPIHFSAQEKYRFKYVLQFLQSRYNFPPEVTMRLSNSFFSGYKISGPYFKEADTFYEEFWNIRHKVFLRKRTNSNSKKSEKKYIKT